MPDLIDLTKPHLVEIAEHKQRKPSKRKALDKDAMETENMVHYAMFQYYARLYANDPGLTKQQYVNNVAKKFHKTEPEISNLYRQFRWYNRAKELLFDGDKSNIPVEYSDYMDTMLANTHLISTLGTRLITDYLTNAQYTMLTAKDIFKLGMLVVECSRVAGELLNGGGKGNQQNANVVKLVINE